MPAAPTFVSASTGTTDASGAWTHTGMAPAQAGNIIILQVLVDGVTAGTPTVSSVTNMSRLSGTDDNLMDQIGATWPVGNPTAAGQLLFIGRSQSTSAPVVTGANTGGDDVYVRMYQFRDVSIGTTLATVIENATAGNATNGVGTTSAGDQTVADTAVQTLDPDRLALQFVALNDDIAIDAFAGEANGDWIEPVGEYATGTGTDGCIQLQTAVMPAAATINGGSDSIATNAIAWGVVGFALIGAYIPRNPAHDFGSVTIN